MLPLRLAARGCVTAAREGCSKFAFTTPNLRPGTDGIGCVSPGFAVGAAARHAAPRLTRCPVSRPFAAGADYRARCQVRSNQRHAECDPRPLYPSGWSLEIDIVDVSGS